jgi:signal transduction histidine kinase
LEELINDDKVPALMKSHLHLMNKNVIRLLRMVNQLIDFRKIEYDKMKIKATKNNIVTFTKDIVDSFKNIADKRNIDLKLASSEKEIKVWFDMNMLDKVFFNLLSNAFKFTKDHGYVHVLIEKKAKEGLVEIRVQDNG